MTREKLRKTFACTNLCLFSPVLADAVTNPEAFGENNPRHRSPLESLFVTCVDLEKKKRQTKRQKKATLTERLVVAMRTVEVVQNLQQAGTVIADQLSRVGIWAKYTHSILLYRMYVLFRVPGVPGFIITYRYVSVKQMSLLCMQQAWSMLSLAGVRGSSAMAHFLKNPSRRV